jgi:DNA polymerase IV (DinB-like DNA polymerase)
MTAMGRESGSESQKSRTVAEDRSEWWMILPTRVIILVDLDYFYAQSEELRNPSLKNKPVVVCVFSGRTEDSGAVSTANYFARGYGVKSGMPIFLAKKKLENVDAVFLPVDEAYYEETSNRVMQILRANADEFEQVSVDEAYLDVTKRVQGDFQNGKGLAEKIKEELRNQVGLTCSIGIGPNKLVAKIAADEKKPEGLTIVKPDQIRRFLEPLPPDRLLGVGTKTHQKMTAMGICTISDLARYDVQKLISTFGKTLGTYFHNASLGVDDDPVKERGEAGSLSRIATLKQNTDDLNMIREKTNELCLDLHRNLNEQKLTFKSVSIIAIAKDLKVYSRSRALDTPTSSLEVMKAVVLELLEDFLNENPLEIRRVGVKLAGLSGFEKSQKQITSFFSSPEK